MLNCITAINHNTDTNKTKTTYSAPQSRKQNRNSIQSISSRSSHILKLARVHRPIAGGKQRGGVVSHTVDMGAREQGRCIVTAVQRGRHDQHWALHLRPGGGGEISQGLEYEWVNVPWLWVGRWVSGWVGEWVNGCGCVDGCESVSVPSGARDVHFRFEWS